MPKRTDTDLADETRAGATDISIPLISVDQFNPMSEKPGQVTSPPSCATPPPPSAPSPCSRARQAKTPGISPPP